MKYIVLALALICSSTSFAGNHSSDQSTAGIPNFNCDNRQESWSDGYFGVLYEGGKVTFQLYEGEMIAEAGDLTISGQEIAILNRRLKKTVEGETVELTVNASLNYNPVPKTLAITLLANGEAWHAEEVLHCN